MGDSSGAKRGPGRPAGNHRLIIWGEKREEPDWDDYVSALLDFCMGEVERREPHIADLATVLAAVGEQKQTS